MKFSEAVDDEVIKGAKLALFQALKEGKALPFHLANGCDGFAHVLR